MSKNNLTISELARAAEVGVETIRFYQRRGLLEEPPKPSEGYRRYDAEQARRLRFIKRAQTLGFSLREVEELLSLRALREGCCSTVRNEAKAKVRDIDEKILRLRAMRRALAGLIEQCDGSQPVTDCPILAALDS